GDARRRCLETSELRRRAVDAARNREETGGNTTVVRLVGLADATTLVRAGLHSVTTRHDRGRDLQRQRAARARARLQASYHTPPKTIAARQEGVTGGRTGCGGKTEVPNHVG